MNWWKNLSVSKKLYCVVGTMGIFIAIELFTLMFALGTLSAVRAFIAGESQWSKAQKDSISYLQKYVITQDEKFYLLFQERIKVPLGDFEARIEMEKPRMDVAIVTKGLIAGKIHPDDIPGIIKLMQRFSQMSYLENALKYWRDADILLMDMINLSERIHKDIQKKVQFDSKQIQKILEEISIMNDRFTVLEDGFSSRIVIAAKFVEKVVAVTLILAVITVGIICLVLTMIFSKTLTSVLKELNHATQEVGKGNLHQIVPVRSGDELGQLAKSINFMTESLRQQMSDINIRDEFVSVASHELKTPLTTLKLLTQMKKRSIEKENHSVSEREKKGLENEEIQLNRLIRLVDDMLDISRIRANKFVLKKEEINLVTVVKDVCQRLQPHILEGGSTLEIEGTEVLRGNWDGYRLEQVVINLLTNAIKYGSQKPITVRLFQKDGHACFSVSDQGIGIDSEDKDRIFEQFERAIHPNEVSGLGLGLYIARQIVYAHKGSIVVESERGKGSTFTVSLPA